PYHTLSPIGLITNVNEKWCQILGFSRDEVIGRSIFDFVIPTERESARASFEKKKLQGNAYIAGNERRYVTKTGQERVFVIHDFFSFDHDNNVTAVHTTMEDVSERKQMEKELQVAHQKLQTINRDLEQKVMERTAQVEQLLKQKDEFITQLGHDLKTPLSILLNVLPLIREEIPEKDHEDCDIAIRNVNYIKNLVTETLKIAELSSLKIQLNWETIHLKEFIQETFQDKQLYSTQKTITFENNVDPSLSIEGDKLRLGEVFINIIGNAYKYISQEDGVVTIDAKKVQEFVVVSVKDTGIGLPPEHVSKIFNEFYKVDPSRHDLGSSGLGLSICKRIIQKHGGQIWAESPGVGKGTTIHFTVPIWRSK
ncbi:MAG: PAS domain-containing sensor histidine kinase, partial [Methanobacteriota archaeon]